jgi:hypothetical protein
MGIQTVSQALSNENGGFSPFGFKNRIINGAMVIDQRNAGASVTPSGSYIVDRWIYQNSQSSKVTAQQNQNSVTSPTGFTYYSGITSSSAYSLLSTDYFLYRQFIEGFNVADLAWGTASAATVTLSFWVRSSLTGTFGGALNNSAQNRSYPFTYTISAANTFEYKTVTIPGDTSGTWLTTNGTGLHVGFSLGTGSTVSGTAGAWAGATYFSATGATSVVSTNAATWYVTGVQLEKAPQATAFDYRDYGRELIMCQRYFISYGGTTGYERFAVGACSSTITASVSTFLPVPMRVAPSLSYSALSHFGVYDGGNVTVLTGFTLDQPSTTIISYTATVASGLTQYRPGIVLANNTTSARILLSAEL